ncbi:MAG: pyridoxamine 5'-phosphate oxidase family protein [Rhodobacteraceae bacterium]|nr:pyridoxamine 5'-phosphate oxidase family protein [Paracoccaceae bacterium]
MSMRARAKADLSTTLFDVLADVRVGMLGPAMDEGHMQPMTHFADKAHSRLWFITSAKTNLARGMREDGQKRLHHCVVSPDQDFYACLTGIARINTDPAQLKTLWSPMVAAWFPGGREDPDVTLIELPLTEASVWTVSDSALVLGVEMGRSLLQKDHLPDVGDHMTLRFDGASATV